MLSLYFISGSTAVASNFYGQGTSLPYINIACNSGGETNLTQCNYSPCGLYNHVGVQCIGNRTLNVVYYKCACVCALVIQISILYWRANEASETLGCTNSSWCGVYICMEVHMS